MESYRKGTTMDSIYATKYNNLIDEVSMYKKQPGKKCFEAGLLLLVTKIKKANNKEMDQRDLFGPAYNYYLCGNISRSDSLFKAYIAAYPDSIHGYYWDARIQANLDSTMTLGS